MIKKWKEEDIDNIEEEQEDIKDVESKEEKEEDKKINYTLKKNERFILVKISDKAKNPVEKTIEINNSKVTVKSYTMTQAHYDNLTNLNRLKKLQNEIHIYEAQNEKINNK